MLLQETVTLTLNSDGNLVAESIFRTGNEMESWNVYRFSLDSYEHDSKPPSDTRIPYRLQHPHKKKSL